MSETTELPAVKEAMTAHELLVCKSNLSRLTGPKAHVSVGTWIGGEAAYVSIDPEGIPGKVHKYFTGKDWPEAFAQAYDYARSYGAVKRNATIRRMALAIIEITDEHGRCTAPLLLAKNFDDEEIAGHHIAACERAGEMCAGAPFVVEGV